MKKEYLCWIVTVIVLLCVTSCYAETKKNFRKLIESEKESGYGKIVPDSIVNIIFGAQKICCELQSKSPMDTLRTDTITCLPKKMIPVVQFLILNKENYQSDRIIYSQFISWVEYRIKARKKRLVKFQVDFGSSKWRLITNDDQMICKGDLKENYIQFLFLTQMLFPTDETLKMLNDNLKTEIK